MWRFIFLVYKTTQLFRDRSTNMNKEGLSEDISFIVQQLLLSKQNTGHGVHLSDVSACTDNNNVYSSVTSAVFVQKNDDNVAAECKEVAKKKLKK